MDPASPIPSIGAPVVDAEAREATVVATDREAARVTLRLADGAMCVASVTLLRRDGDRWRLEVPAWALDAEGEVVLAAAEERLSVQHRPVRRGGVRLERRVETTERQVAETVRHVEPAVERIPVGCFVSEPPTVREEDDRIVIPVVEEVLVVEKRLRLVEEIHVVRRTRREDITQTHALRRSRVDVRFLGPEDTPDSPARSRPAVGAHPRTPRPPRPPMPRSEEPMAEKKTKTLVALYPTPSHARDAIRRLKSDNDIDFAQVSVIAHNAGQEFERLTQEKPDLEVEKGNRAAEGAGAGATAGAVVGGIAGLLVGLGVFILPGVGAVVAAGPIGTTLAGAGIGAAAGGLLGALVGLGIPEEEAQYYAEGVRRGGVLLVVRSAEGEVDAVTDTLEEAGPLDIEEAAREWRREGWKGYDAKAEPYSDAKVDEMRRRYTGATAGRTSAQRGAAASGAAASGAAAKAKAKAGASSDRLAAGEEKDVRVPVVEEEMDIGKRPVVRGAVRVKRYVTATPVEERVRTRQEHVEVERESVDRPVRPGDAAFREGTIEVTEMGEEVVAEKRARVKEEVRVRKDVEHEVEKVEDEVRRADVEVEKVATGKKKGAFQRTKHVEASADAEHST